MLGRMKIGPSVLLFFFTCYGSLVTGTVRNVYRNNLKDIKAADIMDVSDFSVYYDLHTNETIKKMMPRPWYKPGWMLRLPFTGGPCQCEGMQCRCCTGIRIPAFKFDRQTCAVLAYNDSDSLITMDVQMNNSTVYRNSFSARNPPPFCVPIPVPYLPPGLVDMCVRLFDINVMDQRLHVCMDMDTRVDMAPVLVLHFDCMDMGLNGIGLSKPGGSDTNSSPTNSSTQEPDQLDSDVYDPVIEETGPTTQNLYNISVKYI